MYIEHKLTRRSQTYMDGYGWPPVFRLIVKLPQIRFLNKGAKVRTTRYLEGGAGCRGFVDCLFLPQQESSFL